ncbi:30S ribosomal protein S19e [archaeon]|jgi:small subunit ribosomal protein S19e|nr:30S ribosomal protein S19e [archaeon]MBT6182898.1 30S ribosomal protein S19e [archaeon]MBT6606620.1 30S ribosomal protein S19e [archaeon]MBT7251863.1 30S ribosomal protein S19e [archaeon]MBT7661133.1 30S ribosomal protein S19e [archaeon]
MAQTIYAKDPELFIPALADALKKIPEFEAPEWVAFVKTGTSRERPPVDEDFWYIRSASILRQLYIKGVVGVGKLRSRYGSRKDRGGKPDKFKKSGGKIIRVILQQAEEAGLVEKVARLQFGRRLTQSGRDLLDSIEVEEKKGLDFENTIVVPKEVVEDIQEENISAENVQEEAVEGESNEDIQEEVVDEETKPEEKTE